VWTCVKINLASIQECVQYLRGAVGHVGSWMTNNHSDLPIKGSKISTMKQTGTKSWNPVRKIDTLRKSKVINQCVD